MNDDIDPTVADALRRFADSAPQPREDRLQAVLAGVRRRQYRTVGASAVGLIALVAATTFGVHAWHRTAFQNPSPAGSFVESSTSQPPSSFAGLPSSSSLPPSGAPSSEADPAPSGTGHRTPSPSNAKLAGGGNVNPTVDLGVSPKHVADNQQIQVTVTVRNTGSATMAASQFGIGTMVPSTTFDVIPSACTRGFGGAYCAVGILRPGQKYSFSFVVTEHWAPMDDDEISLNLTYVDARGQQQQIGASQTVTVSHDSEPPESPSPSTSSAPNSAPPTAPNSASPTAQNGAAASVTPAASS